MITQSVLSLQYVQAQVQAMVQGEPYNPTADSVAFAFTANGVSPSMWTAGSWDGTSPRSNGTYVAQVLVGPGGAVTLPVGTYTMWLQVTDSPEIPVISVGLLTIN